MLIPKYSEIKSRSEVDLSVQAPKGFKFDSPIVPSNMKTIMGYELAKENMLAGNLTILHRFMVLDEQLELVEKLKQVRTDWSKFLGTSVGVKPEDFSAVDKFVKAGVNILTIDIAHGHSLSCIEMCKYISKTYPHVLLIAGNVATGEGAKDLWLAGADIVKCGIGGGANCSTRVVTGNGVPHLSTLMEIASMRTSLMHNFFYDETRELAIMNDGGCRASGDFVKAACFSEFSMCASIFSGCEEAAGELIEVDGKKYKRHEGSSTHKDSYIEGVKVKVPLKGSFKSILDQLKQGLASGASYQGVRSLLDLQKDPEFVKISNAGLNESHPHHESYNK